MLVACIAEVARFWLSGSATDAPVDVVDRTLHDAATVLCYLGLVFEDEASNNGNLAMPSVNLPPALLRRAAFLLDEAGSAIEDLQGHSEAGPYDPRMGVRFRGHAATLRERAR